MVQNQKNQHEHVIVSNQASTSSGGSGSNVFVMTTDNDNDPNNDDNNGDDPFPAEDTSYTRYAHYPPYCSTTEEIEKRAIPPLSNNNNNIPTTQLVHVTALIRHGSRTPFAGAPSYQCWNGYWDSPDTGIWNCDLKTYMSPPATTKEKHEVDGEGNLIEEEPDFLFEKRYDALSLSSEGGTTGNILNGTCQMGQLLAKGYEQELRNGKHLREAYFYDGENTVDGQHAAADPRMRLWDLTKHTNEGRSVVSVGDETKAIYQEPNLRYRADDEQRTLMSGQVLLRGLFGPELLAGSGDNDDDDETAVIKLHTADYTVDVLTPNGKICPRVAELHNEAYESDEYKKWIETSLEVKTVNTFMKEKMGLDTVPEDILDCMMTTICTDRKLPDVLNDWVSEGDGGMFDRVANFAVKNFTFPYKYNDGAYSKVGMGPLWLEIMSNILQIVDPSYHPSSSLGSSPPPPPKLALFSGHDTTLMPILATLGDKVWSGAEWSPYASMLQFEIHQVLDTDERFPSGYAFRLIYNGNVLTSKMDECSESSDLCDAQVLVRQVMSFANKYEDASCATKNQERMESKIGEMKHATDNLINTPGGILVMCFVALISMALGGVITCILMRRRFRKEYKYTDTLALTELSMSALDDDDYDGNSSAVSPGYETTTSTKKIDDNSLI